MSIAVMSAVWGLDLAKEQKLVLLAFADHADDDGYCWPSLARIAWKCGYTQKRTVSEIVRKLIESQIVSQVEPPHGRTPTKYHIRTHFGAQLPPFDPSVFRDAINAPHAVEAEPNPLNSQGSISESEPTGATNAPQAHGPVDNSSVGVRSSQLGVRSGARRGAVATAPESLTIKESKTRARAGSSSSPARTRARPTADPERDLFLLKNSAKNLGLQPKFDAESVEHFRQRVNDATSAQLAQRAKALHDKRTGEGSG